MDCCNCKDGELKPSFVWWSRILNYQLGPIGRYPSRLECNECGYTIQDRNKIKEIYPDYWSRVTDIHGDYVNSILAWSIILALLVIISVVSGISYYYPQFVPDIEPVYIMTVMILIAGAVGLAVRLIQYLLNTNNLSGEEIVEMLARMDEKELALVNSTLEEYRIQKQIDQGINAILISGLFIFIAFATGMKDEKPIIFWWIIGFFGFVLLVGLLRLLNPPEIKPIDDGTFELTQNGFKVELENQIYECRWTDISTLIGYKMDLFAVDQICMDVFTDDGEGFTITEDTEGWYQFLKHSKEHFSEIPENWENKIAYPPFETNLTLLYDKKNRSKDEVIEEIYENE